MRNGRPVFLQKVPASIQSGADTRLMLDILELLAILVCIPLSYSMTNYIIDNFNLPLFNMEFKLLVYQYFNYFNDSWHFDPVHFTVFTIIILISWFTLSQMTVMARLPRNQRYLTVVIHFIRGNFFILVILLSFKFILNLTSISVLFILTYVLLSMISTLAIRLISIHKLKVYRANGYNLRHVLVIADEQYLKIIDKLLDQKEWGFKIVSIITGSEKVKMKYGNEIPVFPENHDIKKTLDNTVIDEVFYCKRETDESEIQKLAELCNEIGVVFRIQSGLSTVDPMQVSLKTVNNKGKLTLVDVPALRLPLEIKTMSDIYLSALAVIILSPLLLIIAALIKLDSRGPVFFKQERIGHRGRKFKLYKFRTMVVNAEELLEKLRANNEMDGPTFKMKDDPRITRLGRYLRKTGLDEFPQLFNVIKGEMSLIGPRPPLEEEVRQYERWHLRRLSVKPGITCTWQTMPQRNEIKFEKWMRMDLNYIDNWSLLEDLKLFYKTITVFFMSYGR
jgi:exopolysaccharide biosynthesis polyprenyl glycosylphosphotransferase